MRKDQKEVMAVERENRAKEERLLNEAYAITFKCDCGEKVMNHLIAQTLHAVCGSDVNPNSLLHIEGQRYIVGMIKQRIKLGEEKK